MGFAQMRGGLGPQYWISRLHVTLMARDQERSVAFYRDTLDLPEMMPITISETGTVVVDLKITATNYLELLSVGQTTCAAPEQNTGLGQLCLGVPRIEPVLARLGDRGVSHARPTCAARRYCQR